MRRDRRRQHAAGKLVCMLVGTLLAGSVAAAVGMGGNHTGPRLPLRPPWREVGLASDQAASGQWLAGLDLVDASHAWLVLSGIIGPARLAHTSDLGRSWEIFDLPEEFGAGGTLDFVDAEHGWLAGGDWRSAWVGRTADGGASWEGTSLRDLTLRSFCAASAKEAWAVAQPPYRDPMRAGQARTSGGREPETLLHTRDGGRSWQHVRYPPLERHSVELTTVQFADERTGWLVAESRARGTQPLVVLTTDDGGQTFRKSLTPPVLRHSSGCRIEMSSPTDVWIASGSSALLHSADGGRTWETVTPGPPRLGTVVMSDCSFPTPQEGWAVGAVTSATTSRAAAVHTGDGGKTWGVCETGVEGEAQSRFDGVVFADPGHGWLVGSTGLHGTDMPPRKDTLRWFLLAYDADVVPERGRSGGAPSGGEGR